MKREVVIVGGGYSGLVQAYYLVRSGFQPKILEKTDRLGGLLGTHHKGSFLIEQGANAFMANGELEAMMEEIGLPLVEKKASARPRLIYRGGAMTRWPVALTELPSLFGFWWSKKWKNPRHKPRAGESLFQWGERSLGAELTHYLLEPAMQGVYGVRADQLDGGLLWESFNSSFKKGKLSGSVAPLGGMGAFIQKMKEYLKAHHVEWFLNQGDKPPLLKEPSILALDLASLRKWKHLKGLASSVESTRSVSLTSITLGFEKDDQSFHRGFGCLFPQKEGFKALGVMFNHQIFPGRAGSGASETWIFGGKGEEPFFMDHLKKDRSRLGPWRPPQEVSFFSWPGGIPLYDQNLARFIGDQAQQKSPFLLVGNYLGDLGLSKILLQARRNVETIKRGYFG